MNGGEEDVRCHIAGHIDGVQNGYGSGVEHKVYKVVLTGGPCGGKTTLQARMSTFFENIGWKVFRVPEAAKLLLSGGVKFSDLNDGQVYTFQENLLHTILQLEKTYFDLAESCSKRCIILCDRGAMDPSAYMEHASWQKMIKTNGWNNVTLRDERYDQVIHVVTAAQGAEAFYTTANNVARSEPFELARQLDKKTQQAWVGHPYFEVIDNTNVDFEGKVCRAINAVCNKIGIDAGYRLAPDSIKRKFLITSLANDGLFPAFQDFDVVHDYVVITNPELGTQARLRRRGQHGRYTYMHTMRRPKIDGQNVELRTSLSSKDYEILLSQRDQKRHSVYKTRRCFLWKDQYFQLDIYREPCHPRCKDLLILETYTSKSGDLELPNFLPIAKEVTRDTTYSMYNLSLKE